VIFGPGDQARSQSRRGCHPGSRRPTRGPGPPLNPNVNPRQQRSAATVDAIFAATVQILEREGQEAFNTNRVASVAGVSIGTLYQYFADKDGILLGLAEREAARIRCAIMEQLTVPWPASLGAVVHAVLYAFDAAAALGSLGTSHPERYNPDTWTDEYVHLATREAPLYRIINEQWRRLHARTTTYRSH